MRRHPGHAGARHYHLTPDPIVPGDSVGIRRDGREPDDLRARSRSPATSPSSPPGRCSSSSAAPACSAPRRSRSGSRRGCGARAGAGSPPSTRCSRARRSERNDREAAQGQAVGAHAGDPAPDRALAARGHRPHDDGRGADHRRLRRAAGRRRHAHRVDLRRLRRAARRVLAARRRQEDGAASAHRPVRGDLGRHRRRAAVPRPRLLRGRAGRGRHERGDDRRRALRRGAGHRRGRCRSRGASSTTCSAWPRRASPRSSRSSARCWPTRHRAAQ